MSATFSLVRFLSRQESTFQKLFSFLGKSNFRILDILVSWHHQMPKHKTRNTFFWITWKVNSLLMKFRQFMSYHKRQSFNKTFHKNCDLKTSPRPFSVWKKICTTFIRKENFWSKLLTLVISKTMKICPNQHTDLLRFLFIEDSLKTKKGLELVSRPHFSENFLIKIFLL